MLCERNKKGHGYRDDMEGRREEVGMGSRVKGRRERVGRGEEGNGL